MNKLLIVLMSSIVIISCSVNPKGNHAAKRSLKRFSDSKPTKDKVRSSSVVMGEVVFLKVHSYRQMSSDGVIILQADYLLPVGRKKINIEEIIKNTSKEE